MPVDPRGNAYFVLCLLMLAVAYVTVNILTQ